MGSGHSTRWCASDRLVAARNIVDLGGVGVAVSGTRGAARSRGVSLGTMALDTLRRALIGRQIQRRWGQVVPGAAWGGRSQERKNPNTRE